jgi:hypothetical protein
MSRLILLALLVASVTAYPTFTATKYTSTTCAGSVKEKLTIPVGLCSLKLKITTTSTGASAQAYSDTACVTASGSANTVTTAQMTSGTCIEIDSAGYTFAVSESTSAYAISLSLTAPTDVNGQVLYLAADSCLQVDTALSMKFSSTSATQTTPQGWENAACTGTVGATLGVQNSGTAFTFTVGSTTIAGTASITTLDSAGAVTTATMAGGTNAPTASSNSASQATFPFVALVTAFVVKMVHGL